MNILIVCTGNTCRSPMAEGILKSLIIKNNLNNFYISSAGISTTDGLAPSINAITAASELEADISMHQSRQLTASMIDEADLILCMTKSQKNIITQILPHVTDKLDTLSDTDIEDPFGQDIAVYRQCATDILYILESKLEELTCQ